MIRFILCALTLAFSGTINATVVQYNYTANHDTSDFTVAGFVKVDTIFTTGTHNLLNEIIAFKFKWTDGNVSHTTDPTDELILQSALFQVDLDTNNVLDWKLCTKSCSISDHPVILFNQSFVDFTLSTTSTFSSVNDNDINLWNQQWAVASVPEPTAIALMCIGILGFVSTRRKLQKPVSVSVLCTNTASV